jgi:hypothetical protein
MTAPEYDPTSGYQPNGGWGYHEWGAAAQEAWDNAGQATQNGDSSTAAEWTSIAQQADANSSSVYVGGGPAYGSGGDSSGFNDGTYWGQGAVSDPSAGSVPSYDTSATPSYDTSATPSYDTSASAPSYDTSSATDTSATPSYDTSASAPSYDTSSATDTSATDSGVSEFEHHDLMPAFDDAGHADLSLGF